MIAEQTTSFAATAAYLPFLNQIVIGDSTDLLRQIPANMIDLVVTSPPYFNQRDYGSRLGSENAIEEYTAALLRIFRECVRVIKPTGSIILNLGDKYEDSSLLLVPYRFAIAATEKCGVKLVNSVTWVKSNPTPRQFKRRLVNSTEPFFHFVKSNKYHYFPDEFLRRTESGKANISANVGENVGKKYFELIEKSDLTGEQKELAKIRLSETIEEVRRGEIQGLRMKIRGIHAEPFGGQDGGRKIQLERNGFTIIRLHGNPLKKDVISTSVESLKECGHPAVYPVQIVEEFLNLLTRPDDVVLDPFIGSGSTAVAAINKKRHFIGFEINADYCEYARQRIAAAERQQELF